MNRAQLIESDIADLAARDHDLGHALARIDPVTVHLRKPGLGTLLHLILEQQISIDAAGAMYRRLVGHLGGSITPEGLLGLDDATMRACGFTRQKAGYARDLAAAVLDGTFDPAGLDGLDPAGATAALVSLRGIGPWTAANYRLWAMGDRDVFPTGDLALAIGWQEIAGLDERPTYAALDEIATRWAPQRTAAAMIVWYHYLTVRGRRS